MPVRGLSKVRSVVGLFVLAHNLLRTAVLAPQLIAWGHRFVRDGRGRNIRGREITENTKRGHATRFCAPITCTRAKKRPRNQEVSPGIGWQIAYAGNRKTLGL